MFVLFDKRDINSGDGWGKFGDRGRADRDNERPGYSTFEVSESIFDYISAVSEFGVSGVLGGR